MKNSTFKIPLRLTSIILGIFSLMLFVTVANVSAQNKKMQKTPKTPSERAEEAVSYWNQKLQLNEDQQGKFRTLLTEEFTKRDSIRSAVTDRKSRYEAFSKLRDETHAKMETILTPEQHKKFVEMRSKKWKKKSKKMKKSSKSIE